MLTLVLARNPAPYMSTLSIRHLPFILTAPVFPNQRCRCSSASRSNVGQKDRELENQLAGHFEDI